ncbi:hypothetical protein HQ576_04965 [bacterium]|nr:hypothetical protein [bacterium]
MSERVNDPERSVLRLAATLRLAAERLAECAGKLRTASGRQKGQFERLAELREQIVDLIAACRHLRDDRTQSTPDADAPAAAPRLPVLAIPPMESDEPKASLPASAFVEFTSWSEYDKFRHLGPITDEEMEDCDIEELVRRLSGQEA